MHALRMSRPYGWRAKIGLITPSTNNINEPEFHRMAPDGVTVHTSRVLLTGEMTEASFHRMAGDLARASAELATAEVDIVAYGCTAGSVICPLAELTGSMTRETRTPAIVTAGAVVAALRALDVRRVAMATPYLDFVNRREVEFLAEHGIEVTRWFGLEMGHDQAERRAIGHVPPQAVWRMACEVDSADAQAVFVSCANLATIDVIAPLEAALGKPVISSNTACFWACLRTLGINSRIEGRGRLLSDCTAAIGDAAIAPAAAITTHRHEGPSQ